MQKEIVSVIYDRKREVLNKGFGKVEIRIYLANRVRKYVTIHSCNPFEWKEYQYSEEVRAQVTIYKRIVELMIKNREELTIENLDNHLGINTTRTKEKREVREKKASRTGFLDFYMEQIAKEKLKPNTSKRRTVVLEALKRYGKLNSFADLTPRNIKGFDDFLHEEDPNRSQPTIHDYHKVVKKFTRMAAQYEYIAKDPYESPLCKFERGKSQERRPLLEDELIKIRDCKLGPKEGRVRDLFIFCAYTGLSYVDSQNFDFETMTENINGQVYIDGKRIKTGNTFFTPILPPAMKVLKKYNYEVPRISNQKANDYLHLVEVECKIHKPLTMHVARHSFATLALSYDIPIEDVARMMGHSNIRTTQVYAKILKKTIERHASNLANLIK
ncbi:MAG: phage integrase SAM-like domain-containing protein [Bacteroidaceae bacterium]|nr:phage integrase SAM-like domain-containing protein [Bacteroidaceae bacterium]